MHLDGLPERVCGHCGSRAFRIPVGSERPVLACRYCGKITMLDASDGQAEPGGRPRERLRRRVAAPDPAAGQCPERRPRLASGGSGRPLASSQVRAYDPQI